jgi:hypothetical protein
MMSNRQEKVSSIFQSTKKKEATKSAIKRSSRIKKDEREELSTPTNGDMKFMNFTPALHECQRMHLDTEPIS